MEALKCNFWLFLSGPTGESAAPYGPWHQRLLRGRKQYTETPRICSSAQIRIMLSSLTLKPSEKKGRGQLNFWQAS